MEWKELIVAFLAGAVVGLILSLLNWLVLRLTTGETNFVLSPEPGTATTSPVAGICPRCGSPIDETTHTTRHYETTSKPALKWSETYCGNPPHLKSRTPSR